MTLQARSRTSHAVPTTLGVLTAAVACLVGPPEADACTTILIGKSLTADGSVIHAHNEDMGNDAVGRLWAAGPSSARGGQPLRVPYVELPRTDTYGYWASGNAQGGVGLGTSGKILPYDSVLVGLNQNGLSMSCNWAHSREENREGEGIRRYAIRQLLLEQATSARHAVEILGELIEEHGQADWGGLIYNFADTQEAWVVETTTRNWVARRVRDDEIHVTANRFRIGSDYDLASATLVHHAVAEGWLASADDQLSFKDVYGLPERMQQAYDALREERVTALLKAKAGVVTPEDLMIVLSDRYEGTALYTPPQLHPVWREDLDEKPELNRTISTNLAQSTFVAHLRSDLPVAIGAVMWFGLATPSYAGYFPLYAGGDSIPSEFSDPTQEEEHSAWWTFRRLQRAADERYETAYPSIDAFWTGHHAIALQRQGEVEAQALALLGEGEVDEASELLSAFTSSQADQTLYHARRLLQLSGGN